MRKVRLSGGRAFLLPGAVFLDASFIVAFCLAFHPRNRQAAEVMAALEVLAERGYVRLATSALALQEFWWVAGGEMHDRDHGHETFVNLTSSQRATAVCEYVDELQKATVELLGLTIDLLDDWTRPDRVVSCLDAMAETQIGPADACHLVTMRHNGIEGILSSDRHFDYIAGVRRIPFNIL